nr:M6 family metalloprotease domain-containing protein [Salinivirgaceae bacterium]
MRKIYAVLTGVLMALLLSGELYGVQAYPEAVQYKLPDETTIEIFLKGDEKINWAETIDGYSVLLNGDGFYEYAILNDKGDMVRSGVRAYDKSERPDKQLGILQKIENHIRFSESQAGVMRQIWEIKKSEASKSFPTTGNSKLICILMGFQDQAFTKTQTDFNDLFNQVGYSIDGATGSVKDYYLENSYDQFNLTVDVAGPYTASENMYYYGGAGGTDNPRPLVSEAIDFADPDVDFADYDNDGDGAVDGVYIIYAGYGKEAGGPDGSIWAHAWELASPVYKDGVSLQRYSCSAELRGNSGTGLTRIGVICHEFGHVLGAPDYYDTDYETGGQYQGTGQWDMMAGGSWNNGGATPAHHNGFTKVVYYNWATVTELTSPTTIVLNNAAENSNSFYKINTTTSGEYFLIENREKHLFDAAIPGSGMIVYHAHSGVLSAGSSNSINDTDPQKMYPVAQNATGDPESTSVSYGTINTASCAWTGSGKTEFSDASLPSMKSWAGANTESPITNISRNATAKTVTFDFMGGAQGNPINFTATGVSTSQIDLAWQLNDDSNPVLVAYSTDGTFGTPVDGTSYISGNAIPGGGTVLYSGSSLTHQHTGLDANTTIYYKAWSAFSGSNYSPGIQTSGSTLCDVISSLPFEQNFDGSTNLPGCWSIVDNEGAGQVWQFGTHTSGLTGSTGNYAYLNSDTYGS